MCSKNIWLRATAAYERCEKKPRPLAAGVNATDSSIFWFANSRRSLFAPLTTGPGKRSELSPGSSFSFFPPRSAHGTRAGSALQNAPHSRPQLSELFTGVLEIGIAIEIHRLPASSSEEEISGDEEEFSAKSGRKFLFDFPVSEKRGSEGVR